MSETKFKFDYIKNRKIYFIISGIIVIFSILSTFIFGAKLDIQFKGGTLITYLYEGDIDSNAFAADAEEALGGIQVKVTTGTDFNTGKNNIQLSLLSNSGLTADNQIVLNDTLEEKYADNSLQMAESTDVSPSSGKEFFQKCIVAAVFAAIVLILYIAIRFKNIGGWLAGICAVIALFHDIIVVYGTFVIFGMEIDANFMAVILTILGYSINDSIVIYDRIRENQSLLVGVPIEELVNISNSQSLRRSLRTSITTFGSMLVVTIVALAMGLDSILSFSVPMMFGIAMGTFNSICFVPGLWVWWQKKRGVDVLKPTKKAAKAKA